jgi:hypothetical protein
VIRCVGDRKEGQVVMTYPLVHHIICVLISGKGGLPTDLRGEKIP